MNSLFIENYKIVKGVAPSDDLYNGDPVSDAVSLAKHGKAIFVLYQKSGGTNTGTAEIKVKSLPTPTSSNATDIAFKMSKLVDGATDEIEAAGVDVDKDGFETFANENTVYVIEVDAAQLADGDKYVQLSLDEKTNDPVLGAVLIFLAEPRYFGDDASAIA